MMPYSVVLLAVMLEQPEGSAIYGTLSRRIAMMSDYTADILAIGMGYGLIMPSVQEMQNSFTSKSKPVFNTQIDEGNFEKEKILEIFQQQILELMKKVINVDAKLKSKKEYSATFQSDEQMEVELVRNVVEVYADQAFKGDDAYEKSMGTIVDQLLTVHDKDAAPRDGKLISLRVKKRTETITILQVEQLDIQQKLSRKKANPQEDIDKMEAKYKTRVEKNMKR
ncbi:hypothetical protein BHYA_0080g00310 [Botrytis hyacinthi]|uniref:Uncharacterized protein n=1 Tax=Botrytis hyacinthi TaxID=278943 RepID=A0A4Z1GY09_9HELO|nr:hypothetical protein BHYA_0080g00310 [Botrytis hyacinthi]